MNQLDPTIGLDGGRQRLSPAPMADWSADLFDLVVQLSRQPAAVTGGLCSARLTLALVLTDQPDTVAKVLLSVGPAEVTLCLNAPALDGLAARLEGPGTDPKGAGATLSLDGVEALLAALLAPIPEISVGRARWEDSRPSQPVLALMADATELPVSGSPSALRSLYQTLFSRTDRMVSNPLTLAALPIDQRYAVDVEQIVGQAALSEADQMALQDGGGVLPDQLWPDGLVLVGGRFFQRHGAWESLALSPEAGDCLLRVAQTQRSLDYPRLDSPLVDTGLIDLVRGDRVLAKGRLVMAKWSGENRQIFQIDRLGD